MIDDVFVRTLNSVVAIALGERMPIRSALAVLLVMVCGHSIAGDPLSVSVMVKEGGKLCGVGPHEASCSTLPAVLRFDLKVSDDDRVSVSPEGCGERAMDEARSVADALKKAGFKRVVVVGFLSEPNKTCAP